MSNRATNTTKLAYIAHRQRAGIVNKHGKRIGDVSNAEINRELQILKRCFSLARKHGKVFVVPAITLLQEAPARPGFLDRGQVDTICGHLPAALAPVVRFAFITGWRIHSEVLKLEWRQVVRCRRVTDRPWRHEERRGPLVLHDVGPTDPAKSPPHRAREAEG